MNVSVIIPNFNGKKLLVSNLPKVFSAVENPKNKIKEVIVVDDKSTDESVNFIKENYPKVKLIKHTKNRGFSAGVNTGARAATGDLLLLLNTDVAPEEDFLTQVINNFSDKKVFAVSLHESGYGPAIGYFENGYLQIGMNKEKNEIQNSFYVSGGSGLFRKSIWKELGGMDQKLLSPFYWEDIDLCFRASKRGYKNLWDFRGKVTHIHESTISKLSPKKIGRIRERNQLLVIWKNIHSKSLIKKHIWAVIKRAIKHPGYFVVVFMALSRFSIVLKARKKEIKEVKVSDEAIFGQF